MLTELFEHLSINVSTPEVEMPKGDFSFHKLVVVIFQFISMSSGLPTFQLQLGMRVCFAHPTQPYGNKPD